MRLREITWLYDLRVKQLQWQRSLQDALSSHHFAASRTQGDLPYRVTQHQSLLLRRLDGVDMQLQENKVVNLELAGREIDGVLIRPGETFAFWRLVGDLTEARGYLPGLELWYGEARPGIGGGLCQLANLLYWMALHTPLEVVERHHHCVDLFPDDRRVLPFGVGATVFPNYVDLRFYNPTEQTFQFRVWLSDEYLHGSIATDRPWPYVYQLEERNHRFFRQDGRNYRENEVWRIVTDRETGQPVRSERLMQNLGEVLYELPHG